MAYGIYWLDCPRCGLKSPVEVDIYGYAGTECPVHGFAAFIPRPPTTAEREEVTHRRKGPVSVFLPPEEEHGSRKSKSS